LLGNVVGKCCWEMLLGNVVLPMEMISEQAELR